MPTVTPEARAAAAARALPFLVALSGAAALVYESLWMRSFGLIFGGTTSAVAMVLAVFMGGMALGSALAARRPAAEPLRAYARVELAVGATALLTLPSLRALPWAYGVLVARAGLTGALEHLGIASLAALVLLPPTILLGATMPLAVEFLARAGTDVRAGFGRLYLLNTLGGALGVALAPFVLVPALGVRATLVAAAGVSLFVGGVTRRWSLEMGPMSPTGDRARPGKQDRTMHEPAMHEPAAHEAAAHEPATHDDPRHLGPTLAFASGAATFGIEVLWTRSYALVIGSSVYAFNVMLLAVLLGIAAGSAIYARVGNRIVRPARDVGALFVVAGLAAVAGQWTIGTLPIAYLAMLSVLPVSFGSHQLAGLALCLVTMLPVTLALGLTFPVLLHLARPHAVGAQEASGRLYAWNTAGAIGGALAADLLLVRHLGIQRPYMAFAGLLVAGGAWALAAAAGWKRFGQGAAVAAAAALAAALVPFWTPWDPVLVTSGVHRYGLEWVHQIDSPLHLSSWLRKQRTLVFYREGREAVVAVSAPSGTPRRFLSINGKTDAGSGALDVVQQKFLAHVPMLLHPRPRRALVIGWGSGASAASAALYPVEDLECVEIEPATWEAAPLFAELSGRLRGDPRFHLVFGDARNHILRSRGSYDVIVSEPSNAWISGVSNLFTREFHEAALSRLAPGGLFAQWFHYYSLEPADVRVEVKTFLDVFPNVSLWLAPPVGPEVGVKNLAADLLLVGSRDPQRLDWPRVERAFADPAIGGDLRATGVLADAPTFVATWTMGRTEIERWVEDRASFPRGTPLNTDDHPHLEFVAPRRNVMGPGRAAALASSLYSEMARSGGVVQDVLTGAPSAGAPEAAFLRTLADRYYAAIQPERVERTLRLAVSRHPDDARAWESLGGYALDRHDYRLAAEAHRELVRLEPGNSPAWLRLGAALARQEQWGEARDAIARARALDPKAPVDAELVSFLEKAAGGLEKAAARSR
jgi:spermidine synthase